MLGSSPYVSADTLRQLAATSTAAGSTRSCANLQVDQSIDSKARRHTGCHARGGMLRRACADLYSFGREQNAQCDGQNNLTGSIGPLVHLLCVPLI